MLTYYNLTITSKNKQSLNFFLFFLFNKKTPKIKELLTTAKLYKQKPNKKKIITALKSPHVNKNAQEQVEFRIFSKEITLITLNSTKLLIFLKTLKQYLFPEINIKFKFIIENKTTLLKIKRNYLNPINFKINSKTQNIIKYLKILDTYGELYKITTIYKKYLFR